MSERSGDVRTADITRSGVLDSDQHGGPDRHSSDLRSVHRPGSIVVSELWGTTYDGLDDAVAHLVIDVVDELRRDAPSSDLQIEWVVGARDRRVRLLRVSETWRIVLITLPARTILVAVLPHTEAYAYATDLVLRVNDVTGAAEVVHVGRLAEAMHRAAAAVDWSAPPVMPTTVSPDDLVRLGVPRDVANGVVAVTDERSLFDLAAALPRAGGEAVLDLHAGLDVGEVWAVGVDRPRGTEPAPPSPDSDVVAALTRPQSRPCFTSVDDEQSNELQAVLKGASAAWQVWLHPAQRRLASHVGWTGPSRVTGVAGTGKTVTALHRARHLARHDPDGRTLFVTHTPYLARTVRTRLAELAGAGPTHRIDVRTVDEVAAHVLRSHPAGRALVEDRQLVADAEMAELWTVVAAGTPWPVEFLRAEWSLVVLAQLAFDEGSYLSASRSGRGRALTRAQRASLWEVFDRFGSLQRVEGVATVVQQAAEAAALLGIDETVRGEVGYDHAVIDEAEQWHPAHWRLLRALVPAGPDDLFIVGDPHQRIDADPVPLSRFGIETRGRSRRLTVNHRTSREILKWCLHVIDPDVDDLDGGTESQVGVRSRFDGPEPSVAACLTRVDENQKLVSRVRSWLDGGTPAGEIAVLVREPRQVAEATEALATGGVGSVHVMTVRRAKGMEFRAVALPYLGRAEFPVRSFGGDGDEGRADAERNLLYLAASRAREALHVSCTGRPSHLVSDPPSPAGG